MKCTSLILYTVIILISCSNSTNSAEKTLTEELQALVDNAITEYGGATLAVLMPDGQMHNIISGYSHEDKLVNHDMVFSAGSITKMFTAVSILKLVEENKLSLDDEIGQYLPEYPNIDNTITIRQLLNHTGGIFDLVEHETIWSDIFSQPDRMWTPDEVLNTYTNSPYFAKGNDWHYSSTGYILLRMLIENVSLQDLGVYHRENIFDPLEMKNTYLYPFEALPNEVAHGGWDLNNDGQYEDLNTLSMNSFYSMAMGGIFCTAEDLALWTNKLLNEKSIITHESLNQMLTLHSPCPGEEELVEAYGLGIFKYNSQLFNGLTVYGHGGNAPGYAAGCFYLPDSEVSVAMMVNTEHGEAMWIVSEVVEKVLDYL